MAELGDPRREESPPFWRDGRAALRLVFQSRLVLLVVCVLTFVASLQFFLEGRGLNSLDFLTARQVGLWHILVSFQPTLWVTSLLSVFGDSKHNGPVWPDARRERLALLFCAVFIFVIAIVPAITQFLVSPALLPTNMAALFEVPRLWEKILLFNSIGSVVGVLLGCGMLSVHVQLIGRPLLVGEVLRYQQLRAQLKRCLGFAGAIVSTSLLSVSAFGNALAEAVPTQPDVFPGTAVMGFGIYFTGFLAIIYLPAAKTLSEAGEALAAGLVQRAPGTPPWKQCSEEQQAVRSWLGLEDAPLQELQQGLTLLSPIIASLSTQLLGTGR